MEDFLYIIQHVLNAKKNGLQKGLSAHLKFKFKKYEIKMRAQG